MNHKNRSRLTIDTESLSYINGTGIKEPDTKRFRVLTYIFVLCLILWFLNGIRALTNMIIQGKAAFGVPEWGYRGSSYRYEEEHRFQYMTGDLIIILLFQAFGWFAYIKTNTLAYGVCLFLTVLSLPLPILAFQNYLTASLIIVLFLGLLQSVLLIMIIREIYKTRTDFFQE